jgi:uncharacterized protein YbjT (DUF2867 family)
MKRTYTITGATGHVGGRIAEQLLDQGHSVRAISRSRERLQHLVDKGAKAWVGDLMDERFLTEAYQGVDCVFAIIPPNYQSTDYLAFQHQIAHTHVAAIMESKVKNVVALSAVGAHMKKKAGIVDGLHDFEVQLGKLKRKTNILILRSSYFMENLLSQIDVIKNMGAVASTIRPDVSQPMVAMQDVVNVAVNHLVDLDFKGLQIEYVLGQRNVSFNDITRILGEAIGQVDLKYIQSPYHQAKDNLLKTGMSENVADLMIGMADAINNGKMLGDYKRTKKNTTPTSIEEFAEESFTPTFRQTH